MEHNRFFFFVLIVIISMNVRLFAQYGSQFDNRGFEQWTTRVSEPNHWHSGGTATGSFSAFLSSQIEGSVQVRPGSSGIRSVRVFPESVLGVTANGNLTNGRMNAGSMSATGSGNYNYTQRADEAFNTPIDMLPDSITLWVCFRCQSSWQNANLHAAVHGDVDYKFVANGTEEPSDQLVGSARCSFQRTSTANGNYTWRRLSVPFVKDGPSNDPRYLLFTITTNEVPGQGSTNDDLFVDDILLVYNPMLSMRQLASTQYHFGEEINIPFTLSGTMSADNINMSPNEVIAQLSDSNGSFTNPVELGRVITNNSGSITAQIPDVNSGAYKVRVVSTNYPMIGDNIQEINIENTTEIAEHHVSCSVYPNPATNSIQITTIKPFRSIQLYDLYGRLVKEISQGDLRSTLFLNDLRKGAYLLQVDFGETKIVKSIIKQ